LGRGRLHRHGTTKEIGVIAPGLGLFPGHKTTGDQIRQGYILNFETKENVLFKNAKIPSNIMAK
jgi:hypothetical protein